MNARTRNFIPGQPYLVSARTWGHLPSLKLPEDRAQFFLTLLRFEQRFGLTATDVSILEDGFELVLRSPPEGLSEPMKWFLGLVSQQWNRRHGTSGSLWAGRYRSRPVLSWDDGKAPQPRSRLGRRPNPPGLPPTPPTPGLEAPRPA